MCLILGGSSTRGVQDRFDLLYRDLAQYTRSVISTRSSKSREGTTPRFRDWTANRTVRENSPATGVPYVRRRVPADPNLLLLVFLSTFLIVPAAVLLSTLRCCLAVDAHRGTDECLAKEAEAGARQQPKARAHAAAIRCELCSVGVLCHCS